MTDNIQSFDLPAPIKGLNFIKDPTELDPQECLQLDNYLIYKNKIRERGKFTVSATLSSGTQRSIGAMTSYLLAGVEHLLICTNTRVNKIANAFSGATVTDKTNAVAFTVAFNRDLQFNGKIFLINGTDAGAVYDIASETLTAAGYTPNMSTFNSAWSYKRRPFFGVKNTATYYYGDLDQVSGTLHLVDLSSVISKAGAIVWGASWPVNQGTENAEICVFGFSSGEILIFSGDWPDADNWQLINRVFGPMPVAEVLAGTTLVQRFGQDLLINTVKGLVLLSSVVAAKTPNQPLFSLSENLGIDASGSLLFYVALDNTAPYLYVQAGAFTTLSSESGASYSGYRVYALNHETQGWSALRFPADGSARSVTRIAFLSGYLVLAMVGISQDVVIAYVNPAQAEDNTSVFFEWSSGPLTMGSALEKVVKFIRTRMKWFAFSSTPLALTISTRVGNGSGPSAYGTASQKTQTYIQSSVLYNEITTNPNGTGRELIIKHLKQADGIVVAEISKAKVFYTTGGVL